MRLRLVLFILVVSVFRGSLFANTIYFSQVAFGGGYSTNIVLVNTGSTSVSGRLNVYTPNGSLRSDLSSDINIQGGGSVRINAPNTGTVLMTAWAEFIAGSGNVQGVATFDLRASDGTLVSTAGVLGVESATRIVIPIDVTSTGATGLAINNITTAPRALRLRLYAEDGAFVAQATDARFQPVAPRRQVVDFVTNIFPQLAGTTFRGTLVIEAPEGTATGIMGATALTVKEGMLSALPVISNRSGSATSLEFPQVAFGDGYATTLTVMNTSPTSVAGTLKFYTPVGVLRNDLTTTVAIPAGGSARYNVPDRGPLTVLWAELIVTAGTVQGVATFERRTPAGTLVTSAGISAVQPGNAYILPMDTTASSATGIAVVNVKDAGINLRYRVLTEGGAEVNTVAASRFMTFGARNQMADFVTNVFAPLDTIFKGSLNIEAGSGSPANSVGATALAVKEGLLSALPVIPNTMSACKIPEAANRGDIGLGFPRYSTRVPAVGTVRVKMLFVDFSDAPATQSPQQIFGIISPGAPDFFRAVSYGRLNYQLDPYFVWLRMSKPSTDYGWIGLTAALHRAYVQEAVNLADPNVDFSNSDLVVVMTHQGATALFNGPTLTGLSYTADGRTFYSGVTSGADLSGWGFKWLNHEAGHTMGLVDLYAYSGDEHRFVSGFDIMGAVLGQAPEYFAYERWLLGWLDDSQISCQQSSDATVTLTPIELAGGLKAVLIPTGPNSSIVVESRRAIGYDSALTKTGVLVYTVDTSVLTGAGPIRVYPNSSYDSLLGADAQVTVGNVTIRVLQTTSSADTVLITIAK